jgi:hypothetical protein
MSKEPTYSYFRVTMDGSRGSPYRRRDGGGWEVLHPDGVWRPLEVPLSEQDYDHLLEISEAEAALPEHKGPSEAGH